MVLAYHCIFGMYGFWLPNDPRGSGSDYVASWELFRYGRATKLIQRGKSVAHHEHDRVLRLSAKKALKHPAVKITGAQAVVVAKGFFQAAQEAGYSIHACAILPDHVHLIIGWHERHVRTMVGHLKGRATRLLRRTGNWPLEQPLWGAHGWNVFLSNYEAVERAIVYVEQNPEKERKRRQKWSLVVPFELPETLHGYQVVDRSRNLGGAARASHLKKQQGQPDAN